LTHDDKIFAVKLWGKGLLTVGCGFLAVFVAASGGPCGPSNIVGVIVMMLGILAVPVGAVVFLVGLIKAGVKAGY
jgi:hypothetical protein